jgi:histidyl-tRNA synthetase
LRKQLEYGNSIGSTIVVRVEQKDVEQTVTVKSMVSGLEMKGKINKARTLVLDMLASDN